MICYKSMNSTLVICDIQNCLKYIYIIIQCSSKVRGLTSAIKTSIVSTYDMYTTTSWIALYCGSISLTTFPLQFSALYYYTLSFYCYHFTILGHWSRKNIPPYNLAVQGKNTNWKVESKWHHWTIQTLVILSSKTFLHIQWFCLFFFSFPSSYSM